MLERGLLYVRTYAGCVDKELSCAHRLTFLGQIAHFSPRIYAFINSDTLSPKMSVLGLGLELESKTSVKIVLSHPVFYCLNPADPQTLKIFSQVVRLFTRI